MRSNPVSAMLCYAMANIYFVCIIRVSDDSKL